MISVALDIRRLVDAHIQRQPYQGITRYTLRLYQELKARPDEVELYPVYLHPLDPKKIGADKALQQLTALDGLQRTIGNPVELPWIRPALGAPLLRTLHRIDSRLRPGTRLGRALRFLQHGLLIRSLLPTAHSRLKTDVFHSPVNPLPAVRRTPARQRILTIHDCIYLKRPEYYPLPGRTPAIRLAIDSLDCRNDFVICDSHSTKRDLLEFSNLPVERITVVPLAADDQFARPDLFAGSRRLEEIGLAPGGYLLALAQSEKRKNIPRLIEAYLRSRCAHNLALVLVSSASHAATLHKQLTLAGPSGAAIHVLTDVDDATLSGLLSSAVAFLYVPLYEGFGIPILEAMAAGCPVVTARNSSIPEVACDAALYVDAEDATSIEAGIEEIARNAQLRAELTIRGRTRAAGYSWRRTAEETLEVYRTAMATGTGAGSAVAHARELEQDQMRRKTTRAGAASSPGRSNGRQNSS